MSETKDKCGSADHERLIESAVEKLTDAEYEALTMREYTYGKHVGGEGSLARVVAYLRAEAGRMFADAKDDKRADWTRKLAQEISTWKPE